MILIKQATIYAPEYLGLKDILVGGNKILAIDDSISFDNEQLQVIDAKGKTLTAGFIDRHVHIIGGGGEGGMLTRAPEVKLSDLLKNGLTTVLGLLGTDSTTRTMRELVAKTKAINEFGLNAVAITGAYDYKAPTLTGSVRDDMAFVSEIIGSKIAIADHRASQMTTQTLLELAADVYVGGKLSGKKGVLLLHVGDGKQGLGQIKECMEIGDLPLSVFQPTHINRNLTLLAEGIEFLKDGGFIDLTCGMKNPRRPAEVIADLLKEEVDCLRLTLSSDGNGSFSEYDEDGKLTSIGVASVDALHKEFKYMLEKLNLSLESALPFFTINPAFALGMDAYKGKLAIGYDADMLIFDKDFNIDTTISNGQILMQSSEIVKMIPFE